MATPNIFFLSYAMTYFQLLSQFCFRCSIKNANSLMHFFALFNIVNKVELLVHQCKIIYKIFDMPTNRFNFYFIVASITKYPYFKFHHLFTYSTIISLRELPRFPSKAINHYSLFPLDIHIYTYVAFSLLLSSIQCLLHAINYCFSLTQLISDISMRKVM